MAPPMDSWGEMGKTRYGLPPVMLGIPVYLAPRHFTRGCIDEFFMYNQSKRIPVTIQYEYGCSLVPKARNNIVKSFLKEKSWQYLLFIDDDMIFPPNLYERLFIHDKDAVGAVCVKKVPPHYPTIAMETSPGIYRYMIDFPRDKIFKVDRLGLAITLYKRKVFERIPPPWFSCPINAIGDDVVGEDYAFNDLCKKYEVETWADPMTGEACYHLGEYPYSIRDFDAQVTVGNTEKDRKGELCRATNLGAGTAENIPNKYTLLKPAKKKGIAPSAEVS